MIVEIREGETVPPKAPRHRAENFSVERAVAAYEALFETLIRPNADGASADQGV